ncbi:MAG: 2-hydroxyacyl-CoA dehydratase [Proteobacteria bacterium]|nr:2-hydroxyacyl-CoA dehydratase [Pseudomonadota bacterium]
MEEKKKTDAVRQNLKSIMGVYRGQLAQADESDKPVAWMTAVSPVELCVAMDVLPVFPENYGAFFAARGTAEELCEAAVARGYSEDLCTYALSNLGSMFLGKGLTETQGLPKPDLLIAAQYGCISHLKWWEEMARILEVPLFILDSAHTLEEELKPHQVRYFELQIKKCIGFLETVLNKKMDTERLGEIIALSGEAGRYWEKTLELRTSHPCPMGPMEVYTHMAVAVTLCGSTEAVDHYRMLYQEISNRVDKGEGVVPVERFRLIWDFFPLWYQLGLFRKFEEQGGVFVADVYGTAFSSDMDGADPIGSLVERYCRQETATSTGSTGRAEEYCRLIEDYAVDGVVFHSNRSCRFFSPRQLDMERIIRRRYDLPTFVFQGDMTNPQWFSEEQVHSRITTFFEILENSKK